MKLPQTCDAIVVGGGLTGLITFRNLLAQGINAILIEKSGKIGGSSIDFNIDTNQAEIRSYLWTTEKHEDIFDYEDSDNSVEVLTIGKKGLTPFMGFGESKVQALDFYNAYTEKQSFKARKFKEGFFTDLNSKKIYTHTEITKLLTSEENGKVDEIEVQINGQKTIKTKEIIWTATANDFDRILPAGQYGKFRQKVKKAKTFDCMSVSFELNKENSEHIKPGRYIFFQEDSTPWVGEIFENNPTVYWTAYLDQNQTADHDSVRKQLKSLKKFLAKAFKIVEEKTENTDDDEKQNEEVNTVDAKNIWTNERLTVHKSSLSQLSVSEKDDMMKVIPNVRLLGSSKKFWPHPFEGKIKNFELALPFAQENLVLNPDNRM